MTKVLKDNLINIYKKYRKNIFIVSKNLIKTLSFSLEYLFSFLFCCEYTLHITAIEKKFMEGAESITNQFTIHH